MIKKAAQFALLLFAFGSIAFWTWGKFSPSAPTVALEQPAESQTEQAEAAHSQSSVAVTYFTTDVRCKSCLLIESLTLETLEEQFSQELASGALRFQTRNLDKAENEHFSQDYELSFKTVVISSEQNGAVKKWQKLDDVWTLLNEPEAFKSYVAANIRSLLSSKS